MYEETGYGKDLDDLVYYTAIFLNEHVMGYLAGGLLSVIENEQLKEIKTNFWSISRNHDMALKKRIESDVRKYFLKMKDVKNGELNYHFSITNMMSLDDLASTRDGLVRVRESFWSGSGDVNVNNRLLLNGLCRIDGRIFWGVQFHSKFIGEDLIDFYIKRIFNNFDFLLKN